MNKIITKTILALVGLMMFATTAVAQSTPPADTPYITMTVTSNATVKIRIQADADNTPVWVETAAGNYTSVTVGTSWTNRVSYTANGTTIKVYGNLKGFDCEQNSDITDLTFSDGLTNLQQLYCFNNSLTSLNVSGLTNLQILWCDNNSFTSLDVNGLTNLQTLLCGNNSLTSLDISGLTNLKELYCFNNSLTSLDVSGLTNLEDLECFNNTLAVLDVSGLTNLQALWCNGNSLTSLDVSGLTNLRTLLCFNNNFSTQTIDDIYCSLPQRQTSDDAVIYPVKSDTSADNATVLATNKQNAIDKNWKVRYNVYATDLPATTGTYSCGTGIDNVSAAEQLSISPNPAGNTLNIECTEPVQEVRLYNSLGVEVLRTTQSKEINVSHLSKGVYIVSVRTADGTARQKLIKE